jgi:hypothetical protein
MACAIAQIHRSMAGVAVVVVLNLRERAGHQITGRLSYLMQFDQLKQPLQSLHARPQGGVRTGINRVTVAVGRGHPIHQEVHRVTIFRTKFCAHGVSPCVAGPIAGNRSNPSKKLLSAASLTAQK